MIKLLVISFTGVLIVLLYIDSCLKESIIEKNLLKEIAEVIEEMEAMESLIPKEDSELFAQLKIQFNEESINKDIKELLMLQKKLHDIKKTAVKSPHKEEDSIELLADFTIIPDNVETTESEINKLSTATDSGPTGRLVKKDNNDMNMETHRGKIPDLYILEMKCSLTQLIERYNLEMVVGDYDENYYVFDPRSKSISLLSEEVLDRFSSRGYRQYHSSEENKWKRKAESYLGREISSVGWAYPKAAEEDLISRQLAYCSSLNIKPENIKITYGYYDNNGDLILTAWR